MVFKDLHGNSVTRPKGKEIHWRVSGYGVITNKNGRALMVKASNEQYFYRTREDTFYHSIQLFYTAKLTSASRNTSHILERDAKRNEFAKNKAIVHSVKESARYFTLMQP